MPPNRTRSLPCALLFMRPRRRGFRGGGFSVTPKTSFRLSFLPGNLLFVFAVLYRPRYTNQGDVVVSTSGDRDLVIECALSLARKVEVYPGSAECLDDMNVRVAEAFNLAWINGFFQVRVYSSEANFHLDLLARVEAKNIFRLSHGVSVSLLHRGT